MPLGSTLIQRERMSNSAIQIRVRIDNWLLAESLRPDGLKTGGNRRDGPVAGTLLNTREGLQTLYSWVRFPPAPPICLHKMFNKLDCFLTRGFRYGLKCHIEIVESAGLRRLDRAGPPGSVPRIAGASDASNVPPANTVGGQCFPQPRFGERDAIRVCDRS